MNKIGQAIAIAILCTLLPITVLSQSGKMSVYVWKFTADSPNLSRFAERLTDEFEVALSKADCYQILERRRINELIKRAENESEIQKLNDVPQSAKQDLIKEAQIVIFGRLIHDQDSGEYNVHVSFQNLRSTAIVYKNNTRIRQGAIADAQSRESAMKILADESCLTEDRSTARTNTLAGGGITRQNKNFSVTLKGCTYNRDQVSCQFEFVNSLDREKPVTVNKTSRIYFGANSSSRIAEGSIPVKLNPKGRLTITATFQNVTLGTSSAQILLEIGGVGLERWSWDIYLK